MGRRRKRRRLPPRRATAEINVTPLVDVVLVLLVTFLIISPMLFRQAEVQLPLARTAFAASGLEGHISITLQLDGTLFFEERQIDASVLADELRLATQDGVVPVLIRGDENLEYHQVKQVMDVCHLVGIGDIRLATSEL